MKASVLLKALEAYGDLDVCVIKKTGPMAYNDTYHHKAVDAKVFAIMDDKIIIAEEEIKIDRVTNHPLLQQGEGKKKKIWQRLFTLEQMGVLGIILSELIKL